MSAIRVLQLVASSHGGGAAHVRDLVARLSRDRFDVTVAMPLDGGNVTPADLNGRFIAMDIAQGFRLGDLGGLGRLLRAQKFGIVREFTCRLPFE